MLMTILYQDLQRHHHLHPTLNHENRLQLAVIVVMVVVLHFLPLITVLLLLIHWEQREH